MCVLHNLRKKCAIDEEYHLQGMLVQTHSCDLHNPSNSKQLLHQLPPRKLRLPVVACFPEVGVP
jgi:hypothetical protein